MGFLDELKQRADALRSRVHDGGDALQRHTALAEAACTIASPYLHSLGQHLEVLQPVSAVRFELDLRHVFNGLRMCDFRTDQRRTRVRGGEATEYIALHWHLRSGRRVELRKELPAEIERFEARLRQSGAETVGNPVHNRDTGRLVEMHYDFVADFRPSVRVTPDHERGQVAFRLNNLEGFDTVHADFAAIDVSVARLDELARWIVGEPHRFLDGALQLRRTEG